MAWECDSVKLSDVDYRSDNSPLLFANEVRQEARQRLGRQMGNRGSRPPSMRLRPYATRQRTSARLSATAFFGRASHAATFCRC